MTIEALFNQPELDIISEGRNRNEPSKRDRIMLDSIVSIAESHLAELGIKNARLDLVRNPNHRVSPLRWGYTRIPLLVRTENDQFVIKPYDDCGKEHEVAILQKVQGRFAPEIIYFGDNFYAESFVDPKEYTSLEQMADSGKIKDAIIIGGRIHAELAKEGINYHHMHWLDEFHISEEKTRITDFGASRFFIKEGDDEYIDEDIAYLREHCKDEREYERELANMIVNCFDKDRPRYQETIDKVKLLTEDPVEMLNLLHVLRQGVIGIKQYFDSRRGIASNSWDRALELFPDFVDAFVAIYNNLTDS